MNERGALVSDCRTYALDASAGSEAKAEGSFEFIRAADCSPPLIQEICSFLETQETAHPFQFPQWAGESGYFALYRREGKLCWYAQCGVFYPAGRILRSVRALALSRGPVADDLRVMAPGLQHLVGAARQEHFTFIEILPSWTGSFAVAVGSILARSGWRRCGQPRTTLRLNLESDREELLASFRKVTRYEIRRCERSGVKVTMASNEGDTEDWLRLYGGMAKEKDFEAGDFEHMRQVLCWLQREPHRGGLLLAHKEGRLVGGIVVARSGAQCLYVWGATTKNDKFSPGHLLQWRAIEWAKQVGCSEYDFGGYEEGTRTGTAFFKSGFCRNVVKFLPAFRFIVSPVRQRASEIVRGVRRGLLPFRRR